MKNSRLKTWRYGSLIQKRLSDILCFSLHQAILKGLFVSERGRGSGAGGVETVLLGKGVRCTERSLASRLDVANHGSEEVEVENLSTSGGREHEPDGEKGLENKVHRNPVENRPQTHGLDEVKRTKDDPIGQPLLVIVGLRRLNGQDGKVSGESPADKVGDGLGKAKHIEEDEKDRGETKSDDTIGLGDLCLLLKLTEDGVLVKLGIESRDLAVGNVENLLSVRVIEEVVLDLFGLGGHCECYVMFVDVSGRKAWMLWIKKIGRAHV